MEIIMINVDGVAFEMCGVCELEALSSACYLDGKPMRKLINWNENDFHSAIFETQREAIERSPKTGWVPGLFPFTLY